MQLHVDRMLVFMGRLSTMSTVDYLAHDPAAWAFGRAGAKRGSYDQGNTSVVHGPVVACLDKVSLPRYGRVLWPLVVQTSDEVRKEQSPASIRV